MRKRIDHLINLLLMRVALEVIVKLMTALHACGMVGHVFRAQVGKDRKSRGTKTNNM